MLTFHESRPSHAHSLSLSMQLSFYYKLYLTFVSRIIIDFCYKIYILVQQFKSPSEFLLRAMTLTDITLPNTYFKNHKLLEKKMRAIALGPYNSCCHLQFKSTNAFYEINSVLCLLSTFSTQKYSF